MRVLADKEDNQKEILPRVREIELQRYDTWLAKLEPRIKKGDVKAIQTAVKISEVRAKLTGINAPVETAHQETLTIEMTLTNDALDKEIEKLQSEVGLIDLHKEGDLYTTVEPAHVNGKVAVEVAAEKTNGKVKE